MARAEDESTGYVLPNKTLLEIGVLKFQTQLRSNPVLPYLIRFHMFELEL